MNMQEFIDELTDACGGSITKNSILTVLESAGLLATDPRVKALFKNMDNIESDLALGPKTIEHRLGPGKALLRRAINNELIIADFEKFKTQVVDIFKATKRNNQGEVANYIPHLAEVDPDLFAVAISTIDGQQIILGDSTADFCLQSTSKPWLYNIALSLHGEDYVHQHMGWESSGKKFNDLMLNDNHLPHNPMINAGAIMSTSLINPDSNFAQRFSFIMSSLARVTGGSKLKFNNAVYHSEKETADRNFAIAHYMREVKAFPEDTDINQTLDLYFSACSIEARIEQLAIMVATLAAGGTNPLSGDDVFSEEIVKNCLSMMSIAGMYDYSGEFAFRVGLPAKSGVSGAIMAVVPNLLGIAIYSPRLDSYGNSVRGVEFLQRLGECFNFHSYDSLVNSQKFNPRNISVLNDKDINKKLTFAVIDNDVYEFQRLLRLGADGSSIDTDGNTLLHIALENNAVDIALLLIEQGADVYQVNRFNSSPFTLAKSRQLEPVLSAIDTPNNTISLEPNLKPALTIASPNNAKVANA